MFVSNYFLQQAPTVAMQLNYYLTNQCISVLQGNFLNACKASHFNSREVNSRCSLFSESYVYLPGALFVNVMVCATQPEFQVNKLW